MRDPQRNGESVISHWSALADSHFEFAKKFFIGAHLHRHTNPAKMVNLTRYSRHWSPMDLLSLRLRLHSPTLSPADSSVGFGLSDWNFRSIIESMAPRNRSKSIRPPMQSIQIGSFGSGLQLDRCREPNRMKMIGTTRNVTVSRITHAGKRRRD